METSGAGERLRLLETLVESLPDPLIVTNMRGEVGFLNAAAMAFLGAAPEDAAPGGRGLFTPRRADAWRMAVQEILKKDSSRQLVRGPGPGGGESSFRPLVTMLSDAATGDYGVLLVLRVQETT